MKIQIKYFILFAIVLIVGFTLTLTINNEKAEGSQTVDEHGHNDHKGHEEHEGHEGHGEEGIIISSQALLEAGIVVEKLKPRMLSSTLELSGKVIPHPTAEGFVGSLVEGRIKKIFVDIGDFVSKGTPLCTIESPTVGEAEAAYITELAEMKFLKADLERHNILIAEGIGSKKELAELDAQLASSISAVSATKRTLHAYGFNEKDITNLESDQHSGGNVTLRSPTTGKVINRNVRLGRQVTPETDLFHVVNLKKLRVHVDIPEKNIGEVTRGIDVVIVSQNGHQSNFAGVIDRIGSSIEPDTRTLTAFATVDNSSGLLYPGAFVSVRFSIGDEDRRVLAVPLEAVFKDEHGDQALFVELQKGSFEIREIETGVAAGGWVEITAGVSAGERIVTTGSFAVKSEADKHKFGDGHNH